MSELKPCPFCGGKAQTLNQAPKGTGYSVGCQDDECRGFIALSWVYTTEAEAIEAWNTRHHFGLTDEDYSILLDEMGTARPERTCRITSEEYDDLLDMFTTHFSCGHYGIGMARWFKHCPECGARVEE